MEEVTKGVRQVLFILDGRGAVGGDQVKCSQRRFGQVWRFAFDHLDGHDTQTPDIDLATVLFASNHFWRHPIGGPDHGVPFVLRIVDLGTESEIG